VLRWCRHYQGLIETCFGKEDTFVLDFVNSAEDIQAAFSPYYEETTIEETTDANIEINPRKLWG